MILPQDSDSGFHYTAGHSRQSPMAFGYPLRETGCRLHPGWRRYGFCPRRGESRGRGWDSDVSRGYDQAVKRTMAVVILGLLVASCGDGGLSLAEYNEQGMALATIMEERISALDAAWDSDTATVDDVRMHWDQRIAAYDAGLEGFLALEPSGEVAELHRTGMELFTKLVAAESAVADRVASFETVTGPEQWWATAEGAAVRAAEEEI